MKKEYLAREGTVAAGGVTITVVVRVTAGCDVVKGVTSFYAGKQPVYIIISSGGGERAFDVSGREVPIQQAVADCPEPAAGPA